jgi:hypothetical protein
MIWYIFNCSWVDTWWQSTVNIYTQNAENGTYITIKNVGSYIKIKIKLKLIWEVRAVPRLCELYPGVCLTTEEKARKNLARCCLITEVLTKIQVFWDVTLCPLVNSYNRQGGAVQGALNLFRQI